MTAQHASSSALRRLAAECRCLPRLASTPAALSILAALAAGLALRLFFVLVYPEFDGDSAVYGMIAKNLLVHHSFALDKPFHPTLIRLPGYPFFLAIVFKLFGLMNYAPVRYIQLVIDLIGCLLIFGFVRDHVSRRAAHWALWLSALCPFTANYVTTPMTETISIFCVALALFAAGRLIRGLRTQDRLPWGYIVLTAAALSCAILFRPDGGLLLAAILPGIWWYTRRNTSGSAKPWLASLRAPVLCALLVALPFVPWTIRNYRVFNVFQPLAPRSCSDPGESTLPGYARWTKTWLVDLVSSYDVYWKGDDEAIDIHLLPNRAFDSPEEYAQTNQLILDYNEITSITPEIDDRFAALAQQRISRHPVRFYLVLPMARVADMWLRPRTEQLGAPSVFEEYLAPLPLRWWEWRAHRLTSLVAATYGLLNAALILVAIFGFARRRVPFAAMMIAYIVLRSLLLATLENAEPRYTLECYPILLIAAALAFGALDPPATADAQVPG